MAVKGLISDNFIQDFEFLLGKALPNGLVADGVIGWLYAADDKLDRNTYVQVMKDSFSELEIEQAKTILVEVVLKRHSDDRIRADKELANWIKGRNNPEKKNNR